MYKTKKTSVNYKFSTIYYTTGEQQNIKELHKNHWDENSQVKKIYPLDWLSTTFQCLQLI
jgi:hypothetical protein